MYHDLYIGGKALVERENVGFDLTKSELCPSFVKDLTTKGVVLRVADSHTGNHREDDFTPLETIRRFLGIIGSRSLLSLKVRPSSRRGGKRNDQLVDDELQSNNNRVNPDNEQFGGNSWFYECDNDKMGMNGCSDVMESGDDKCGSKQRNNDEATSNETCNVSLIPIQVNVQSSTVKTCIDNCDEKTNVSYAGKVNNNVIDINNKLNLVPTTINENGVEYVIFDEELDVGGLGYAIVLVEVNAEKKLVDQIEVLYKDRGSNEQFVKKIKVKYDWKPPICSLCKVFGHMDNNCAKMEKKEGNMKEVMKETNTGFINQEEVIPRKDKEDNTNQEEYTTPTKAQKKIWNVDASVIKEVRNSANKFAVLQEVDDENCIVHLSKQEKEEIGKYVMMKIQPSFSATSKWTSEMKEYYKVAWENQHNKDMNNGNKDSDGDTDIEFNENDVYVDRSGIAKFMSENEVDGVGRDRKELWKDLNMNKRVAGNDPWVIMGDVNVSLHRDDHSEGMSNYTQDMIDLQNYVNCIEVEDINWSGLHFTWTKSLLNRDNTILKKIDRIMGNNPFLAQYSNVSALFLPYGISDHSPAILKIPQAMKKKNKSFRLANNITDKAEFYDLVKDKWGLEKVNELKAKLYDIHSKIDMDPTNKDLRSGGVEILRAYKEVVIDKEKLLRQNTKVTWLSEGDKNSAYFHKVLKGRINRSRIMSVCDENGVRYKNCDVAEQFVKHFEGFLGINLAVTKLKGEDASLFEKKITEEDARYMIREVSEEEIRIAVFDIDDDKAPRPDGFTSKFFRKS
ncbi:RNA-directed DNA polymerase, eukaryota, reverse transcriptase zinc-binding domain protein [Tanacetum coccineum]